jgi:hypothetical protein
VVERPEFWPWSSYPGFCNASRRLSWVDYEQVLKARRGDYGGTDPARDYRRFVAAGLAEPPRSPFLDAFDGWVLGTERFIKRLRKLAGSQVPDPIRPEARRLSGLDPDRVCAAVAEFYGLQPEALTKRHDGHIARAAAAWLCRRHSEAPLRELADRLGLSRADSVPNLTRKLESRLRDDPALTDDLQQISRRLEFDDSPPALLPPNTRPTTERRRSMTRKTKNQT